MADFLSAATNARNKLSRFVDVVGSSQDAIVSRSPSSMKEFADALRVEPPKDVASGSYTAIGAIAGTILAPRIFGVDGVGPRVLGAIGGMSVGKNATALFSDVDRKSAALNLMQTGTAIAGAFIFRQHPVLGFVVGWVSGAGIIYFGGLRK